MIWNSACEITQYEVVFKWSENLFETLILSLGGSAEDAGKKTVDRIARSVCNSPSKYNNDTNTQYESWEKCYGFLTEDLRVG